MKLLPKIVLLLLWPAFIKAQTRRQMDSAYLILQHGGEIKVETNEGEGSIFKIELPTI